MTPAHGPVTVEELDGIDPKTYHRRWAILATMCLSLVLIVATVSSVNVAIPALAESELRPSDTQILWIVDAYALVFAALLLPAGALGDRFGRKGALLIGLVIFASASAACAFMTDSNALIACRSIMGIGAALIMPSTLSLLQSAFPRRERAKAIAMWAGFAGAGGAIGPVLGGLLAEHFWYGSVFFVAAPIATVAFVASWVLAPSSREATAHKLDPGGAALSIVGFAALLAAIIEGPERGWSDSLVVAGFVIAVVCLVGFVLYERRTSEPMLDMKFFSNRRFAMGSMGITVTFFGMFSLFFLLTQYLQYVQGYSALGAGVRGLPFAATMIIVSPRAPHIAARIGAKKAVGGGMAMLAAGLVMMSFIAIDTTYWYIAACLVVIAYGVGAAMPSLSSGIVQSVPLHKAGVGSAVNDTTREVGGAIGIAVIGSIVSSIYRSNAAATIAQFPEQLQGMARINIARALGILDVIEQQAGPVAAGALRTQVRQAFVDGTHVAFRVGAAFVAIGAAIMFVRLPDGGEHHAHPG
ncbi:MAG: DHA2 family efflux MFS transporter permease subunit [Actinomycetota bacterium]|nr:DHA2 family efflux MFS transporter permease subunit [Actinomycetota bacterium]